MLIQAAMPHIPLATGSVDCTITSIPYFNLRSYDIPSTIWDGDPACEHKWDHFIRKGQSGGKNNKERQTKGTENFQIVPDQEQAFCTKCGAWLGQHGMEPTIALFIQHEVQIFREVWRVLKDTGTLWLNVGDSWNGSGGAGGDYNRGGLREGQPRYKPHFQENLKPKDLMGVPWRVAFALQDDGWYLRSDIVWQKANPMPEPNHDRPTKSHEYIFLLTKSRKYYWNKEGAREKAVKGVSRAIFRGGGTYTNGNSFYNSNYIKPDDTGMKPTTTATRNIRSVWNIPTEGYSGAHFATFPQELVRRCVAAGCPEKGVVYDPFAGSGTTVKVARDMGRIGIGTDLGWNYLQQARVRTGAKQLDAFQRGLAKQGETPLQDLPLFGGAHEG